VNEVLIGPWTLSLGLFVILCCCIYGRYWKMRGLGLGGVAVATVRLPVAVLLGLLVLAGCVSKPGVNSTGTPTTAAEQVAGDAEVSYALADAAWLAYVKSPAVKIAVVQSVEPKRKAARVALDAFAAASVQGNAAAALSAFNSALSVWSQTMVQSGVANVPPAPAP
jgi:hypothetical protein